MKFVVDRKQGSEFAKNTTNLTYVIENKVAPY